MPSRFVPFASLTRAAESKAQPVEWSERNFKDVYIPSARTSILMLTSFSLMMTLVGLIMPRFWHYGNGYSAEVEVDYGLGLANEFYYLQSGYAQENKGWQDTLDHDCGDKSTDALKSCCHALKAGFSFMVIGMVIQVAQYACVFLLENVAFDAMVAVSTTGFYLLGWSIPLGACNGNAKNSYEDLVDAHTTSLTQQSFTGAKLKLEASFVLFMLAWGCCLILTAITVYKLAERIMASRQPTPDTEEKPGAEETEDGLGAVTDNSVMPDAPLGPA